MTQLFCLEKLCNFGLQEKLDIQNFCLNKLKLRVGPAKNSKKNSKHACTQHCKNNLQLTKDTIAPIIYR
jgi:hypothetical protein